MSYPEFVWFLMSEEDKKHPTRYGLFDPQIYCSLIYNSVWKLVLKLASLQHRVELLIDSSYAKGNRC